MSVGGGGNVAPSAPLTPETGTPASPPGPVGAASLESGPADPGLLLLLLPDSYLRTDPRVGAWVNAALETGVRMAPVTDSQFKALGDRARSFGGLILPDDLHTTATDELLAQVKAYVNAGGRAMLTFDFGALTLNSAGQPVFPFPRSRLSDLAGVDYVLAAELRERTTGLAPILATNATLRQLQVPPGKSLAYPLVTAAQTTSLGMARFLPTSAADPGGARGFDPQPFQAAPVPANGGREPHSARIPKAGFDTSVPAAAVANVTRTAPGPDGQPGPQARPQRGQPMAAPDRMEAISGYAFGHLSYPSYVTRGAFDGTVLAMSPAHGLVAGTRRYGAGEVLFVNLPLTYLKGRTDALLMHGFLGYFVNHVLGAAHMSAMPNGIAGLTLNWHLDSMGAQTPTLALEQAGVFSQNGPFSVNMTAGPDTVTPGDGLGWNLPSNPVARDILRRLAAQGHSMGSHGGWIHDYYGLNADEGNQAQYEPYLVLNRNAVDSVLGRPSREYSPPLGNNPTWAMRWLEAQGVVGAYFGGHTGLGITQHYRDGVLLTPGVKVLPVTPLGLYATFEEFKRFNVPRAEVIAWYRELVDFSVQMNTSRLIYMHPPGAMDWLDVTQSLMAYTRERGPDNFVWYTMPVLADHLSRRLQVTWKQERLASGAVRFDASHPAGLAQMVWRLPKARYQRPTPGVGTATVADGGQHWLVKAGSGPVLQFDATPL